ncbi:hypothetical protein MYU51_020479 [Penicillium brevicompactum]
MLLNASPTSLRNSPRSSLKFGQSTDTWVTVLRAAYALVIVTVGNLLAVAREQVVARAQLHQESVDVPMNELPLPGEEQAEGVGFSWTGGVLGQSICSIVAIIIAVS